MDPLQTRRLGKTAADLPILGFGGAPLGGLFEKVDEAQSAETLDTAYSLGIRYYDTAPWHGHGLSEHRTGGLLRYHPKKEFILSPKWGGSTKPIPETLKIIVDLPGLEVFLSA